jgi:energy-coupling factor transport system permease protein
MSGAGDAAVASLPGEATAPRCRAAQRAAALRERERARYGVRRMRPGVAFAYALTLALAALVVGDPVQAAAVLAVVLLALAVSRALRLAWPYVRMSLYIGLVVLVVNPLFGGAGLDVIWALDVGFIHLAVTTQGIVYGVASALRLAGVILAFGLLNLCVDADDQLALVSRLSFRSGLVLSLASRLLPVFSRDAARIGDAQKARGVPLDTGSRRDRAAARLPLLACLLTQSLERAVDVAASMEARGYGAGPRTRWLRRSAWGALDAASATATAGVVAAIVAGVVAGAWSFTFFPLLDDVWTPATSPVWLALLTGAVLPLLFTAPWHRTRTCKG